jgi:PTS system nitrogen regulatory IIA component
MTNSFPDRVVNGLKASSKKQLLQELAKLFAEVAALPERQIFDVLIERERLGTTGMGAGVAIPHGRMAGLSRVYEVFVRLDKPVNYDALDNQPVDLVYALLAPMEAGADHLKSLARASRILRETAICAKLRGSDSEAALQLLLQAYPSPSST